MESIAGAAGRYCFREADLPVSVRIPVGAFTDRVARRSLSGHPNETGLWPSAPEPEKVSTGYLRLRLEGRSRSQAAPEGGCDSGRLTSSGSVARVAEVLEHRTHQGVRRQLSNQDD